MKSMVPSNHLKYLPLICTKSQKKHGQQVENWKCAADYMLVNRDANCGGEHGNVMNPNLIKVKLTHAI